MPLVRVIVSHRGMGPGYDSGGEVWPFASATEREVSSECLACIRVDPHLHVQVLEAPPTPPPPAPTSPSGRLPNRRHKH